MNVNVGRQLFSRKVTVSASAISTLANSGIYQTNYGLELSTPSGNTGTVYFASSQQDLNAGHGIPLHPDRNHWVPIDDPAKVYVSGSVLGSGLTDVLYWMGIA